MTTGYKYYEVSKLHISSYLIVSELYSSNYIHVEELMLQFALARLAGGFLVFDC